MDHLFSADELDSTNRKGPIFYFKSLGKGRQKNKKFFIAACSKKQKKKKTQLRGLYIFTDYSAYREYLPGGK